MLDKSIYHVYYESLFNEMAVTFIILFYLYGGAWGEKVLFEGVALLLQILKSVAQIYVGFLYVSQYKQQLHNVT